MSLINCQNVDGECHFVTMFMLNGFVLQGEPYLMQTACHFHVNGEEFRVLGVRLDTARDKFPLVIVILTTCKYNERWVSNNGEWLSSHDDPLIAIK